MAQCVEIIGIFVAAGDCQNAGTQNAIETVDHTTLIAVIGDAAGKPSSNAQSLLSLSKQQDATV